MKLESDEVDVVEDGGGEWVSNSKSAAESSNTRLRASQQLALARRAAPGRGGGCPGRGSRGSAMDTKEATCLRLFAEE